MATKKKVESKAKVINMNKVTKGLEDFISRSGVETKKENERIAGLESCRKEALFRKAKREKAIRTNEVLPYTVEMIEDDVLPEINRTEHVKYNNAQKAADAYIKAMKEVPPNTNLYVDTVSKFFDKNYGSAKESDASYKEWLLKQVDDHMVWVRKQLESL
jgi:phosphopentomutase